MALRFSANVSWLFPERATLPARLEAAARAGFRAAEAAWPAGCEAAALRAAAARAGLRLVLLNTPPGDPDKGEKGLGAVPGRQSAFREGLARAVQYAKAVDCPRIHLMAGRVPVGADRAAVAGEMETTFIENLRYAADILAQDIFHCQIMDGNLSRNLETYFPLIGHIQIAQVPGRHEPDSPGEVNFPYLFQLLESLGYTGYVGCEYAPKGDTVEGLGWLRSYWESRGLRHGETGKATE
ncbi:putative hydroxypyruvate isomerase isoform X2 [Rhea pennata]|uniref:putative hydroxypyruvate isomerase isoform X2 n=1 Tax=Rhea pennata TaxID=8795 RepID=UPI002E2575B8